MGNIARSVASLLQHIVERQANNLYRFLYNDIFGHYSINTVNVEVHPRRLGETSIASIKPQQQKSKGPLIMLRDFLLPGLDPGSFVKALGKGDHRKRIACAASAN